MTKINPFDLPPEEKRKIRITLTNIRWAAMPALTLPDKMCIPVDSNLPEEELLAKAMDIASSAIGYRIIDCDVSPIEMPEIKEQESLSDTLDYQGEIF